MNFLEDLVGQTHHRRCCILLTSYLFGVKVLQAFAFGETSGTQLHAFGLSADLHHFLLDLLPDTGHAEEDGRTHFAERVAECALQSSGQSEGDADGTPRVGGGGHGSVDVDHLRSDVRERKVAHPVFLVLADLGHQADHELRDPGEVVVADHDGLGVAGGAAGVDQRTAVTGLLLADAVVDVGLGHLLGQLDELVPGVDAGQFLVVVDARRQFALPHDQRTHLGQLAADGGKLGKLGLVLQHHHLAAAVVHDVLDGLGPVGGIDAGRLGTASDRAQVGPEPLGTVETENVHTIEGLHSQTHQRTTHQLGLAVVFLPGPGVPIFSVVGFGAQSKCIGMRFHRTSESLHDGGRFQTGHTFFGAGKIQLRIRFNGPVLSLLGWVIDRGRDKGNRTSNTCRSILKRAGKLSTSY
mmetsp:Transcript_14033/g.42251  ORF Transcript_14033/g.42251 Transcript_14033/m.42251 type:complete len:410 (+) Transcript_14033:897-2126(+)